jgi:MraZ protein
VGESGTPDHSGVPPYQGEIEIMFLGQYEHTIDDKGRMTIPVRFRELLEDGAYITRGFDQNLMVLTASQFDKVYERVNRMSLTDPVARDLKRFMFGHADRVEVDRVGRILIPQFLRQDADLDGDVTVVGAGEYFEIWSQGRWQARAARLDEPEVSSERFAALDLSLQ